MPFQYAPYRNRYVGSITDLMGRGRDAEAQALITAANAQAQAAQVSGQAWGGALQGIGNTIAALPGQIQESKDREYLNEERDREEQRRSVISDIYAEPTVGSGIAPGTPSRIEEVIAPMPGEGPNSMGLTKATLPTRERYAPVESHKFREKDENGSEIYDLSKITSAFANAGLDPSDDIGPFMEFNKARRESYDRFATVGQGIAKKFLDLPESTWLPGMEETLAVFRDGNLLSENVLNTIESEVNRVKMLPPGEQSEPLRQLFTTMSGEDPVYGQNLYDVTLADGTVVSGASQVDGAGGDRFYVDPNGNRLRDVAGVRKQQYLNSGGAAGLGTVTTQGLTYNPGDYDPETQNMLDHAGLSLPEFMVVIGKAPSLARGRTRTEAIRKANLWLREKGIDPSTMEAEFKGYNEALLFNIRKYNLVRGAESEIYQDIQNIENVVERLGLNKVRVLNQFRVGIEGQFNDPDVAEYIFYINQIQSNYALLNWASQGGGGQGVTDAILKDAKAIISAGVAHGTLEGLFRGLQRSVRGMANVNREAVNRTRANVWGLFNVREHYNPIGTGSDTLPYVPGSGPTDGTGGTGGTSPLLGGTGTPSFDASGSDPVNPQ